MKGEAADRIFFVRFSPRTFIVLASALLYFIHASQAALTFDAEIMVTKENASTVKGVCTMR